jgi:hypothetical protein
MDTRQRLTDDTMWRTFIRLLPLVTSYTNARTGTGLLVVDLDLGMALGLRGKMIKNVVYFADAPSSLPHMLFPPSMYELPNSLFFEMTGVMQLVAAAVTARRLYRLLVDSNRINASKPGAGASQFCYNALIFLQGGVDRGRTKYRAHSYCGGTRPNATPKRLLSTAVNRPSSTMNAASATGAVASPLRTPSRVSAAAPRLLPALRSPSPRRERSKTT